MANARDSRSDSDALDAHPRALLSACWSWWSSALASLEQAEWETVTRCEGWDVRALAAHVAPDVAMLAAIDDLVLDDAAAHDDAASVLRTFNAAGGVAETMADHVASTAAADTTGPHELVERFDSAVDILSRLAGDLSATIPHPVLGTVTVGVVTDIAIVEASVHGLDLADAVERGLPPEGALRYTAQLLAAIPAPARFLDVATGRSSDIDAVMPVMR